MIGLVRLIFYQRFLQILHCYELLTVKTSLTGNKMREVKNSQYLQYDNTVRFKKDHLLLHSHYLTYPDIDLNQVGVVILSDLSFD